MSTPTRHALISGASIAGPALAYWLRRYGWQVSLVERAPSLRTGGQNVDVRGAGREVLRRMGLEDAVRAAGTGEVGTRFIGEGGVVKAEFPAGHDDTGGATAELEILRGDLAQLLYGATADETEYLFGDTVAALRDDGQKVAVTFGSGREQAFDLVVAADGLRSGTRDLILGSAPEVRPVGLTMLFLTIPRQAHDVDWWQWYNAPGGRSVNLRPDNVGTIRALLSFTSKSPPGARLSREEQRRLFRRTFRDVGWEAPRVLDELDRADDWYYDVIAQVRAPRWSQGRAAVVGDAAYCASPVSGMGTSLALVGAYVLAGELASHVDHRDAFRAYERIMRPYVGQAQKLPPGTPGIANPQTRAGIGALHAALGLMASRPLRALGSRLFSPPADKIELEDYRHLERPG